MQQQYICFDDSGSTGNHPTYWNQALTIIQQNPNANFIFWDTTARPTNYKQALYNAINKIGRGGTQPQCFAPLIPEGADLTIVTDGQIYSSDVDQCDKILNSKSFKSVTVHFINTGGHMNLSVSAPFTRKTEYQIFVDGKQLAGGSSARTIDLSQYFNEPQKFIDESDQLLKDIVMQNLGRTNIDLRTQLLELQKNLLKVIATNNSNKTDYTTLRTLLTNNDNENSIKLIKTLILNADDNNGKKIESVIQEMIHQCSNSKDFSFDVLASNRLARASTIKSTPTEELPPIENHTNYECPITFETDTPLCLIKSGDPILKDLDKSYLDNIMTNPLIVLNDPTLISKLKDRIDHLVGLEVVKELFKDNQPKSPFTRSQISCALTFDLNHTHMKSTNYTLANLFFGNKLVGLPEMWLYVLYHTINTIPYLSSEMNFMESFKTNMLHRMRTHTTNITLSGLPIDPLMKCPIDIAIWFCVNSPHIINNTTNEDDARNRLRSFGATTKYLLNLTDMFNYPYDKKWTNNRLCLYKAFAWMMNEEKNNTSWRKLLRAQYQNSLTLDDGTIIFLDGPITSTPPDLPNFQITQNSPQLTIQELLTLESLTDRTKTIGVVMIPTNFTPLQIPSPKTNYGYNPNFSPENDEEPTLSPNTFRPVVIDRKLRKHWLACSEQKYGPINKQLSNYNYFIKYVHEFNAYPDKQTYLKFISSRQANKEENPMDTLPKHILIFTDNMFKNYESILGPDFKNVSPEKFKYVTYDSMTEINRAQLDGSNNI